MENVQQKTNNAWIMVVLEEPVEAGEFTSLTSGTPAGGTYSFSTTPRELTGNQSPERTKKVYVRKKAVPAAEAGNNDLSTTQKKKKQLIVAKRVEIDGSSSKKKVEEVPMTVLAGKTKGPKRDDSGNVVETSLLGASEDYLDLKQKLIGEDQEDMEVELKRQQKQREQEEQFLKQVEKKKKTEEKEKQKNIQSMQIFQQTQYLKQERALKRWQAQQDEWQRINKKLATKMGKSEDDLVISKTDDWRNTLEEKEMIERSIFEEKDGYVDPLWRAYQPVGNSLSGLFVKKKDPSTGPVEIIRRPSKMKSSTLLRSSSSRLSERDLQNYKTNRIKIQTPADEDLGGLEIIGTAIQVETERSMMEKRAWVSQHTPQTLEISTSYEDAGPFRNETEEEILTQGPSATIDKNELVFMCPANELCKQSVGFKNCGSTALYYRWKKKKLARALIDNFMTSPIEEENLGLPKNPPILKHDAQRFYFADKKGVLLPGDYKDFVFMFRTPNYGLFFETWELTTEPNLPDSINGTIQLKGIATGEDPLREERQRIQNELASKEIHHGVQDIVHSVIENAVDSILKERQAKRNEWEEYQKEQERKRQHLQQLFDTQNDQLGVPFSMTTLHALQDLAGRVFGHLRRESEATVQRTVSTIPVDWNFSINELHQYMSEIEDFNTSETVMKELNDILTTAASKLPEEEPHPAFLIGVIVRSMVVQMVEQVPEIAKTERTNIGLPHHPFVNPFAPPLPTAASVTSIPKERVPTATSNHEEPTIPAEETKELPVEDESGAKGVARRRRKRIQPAKSAKPASDPIPVKKIEEVPPAENPEEKKLEEVFHHEFLSQVSETVINFLLKMEELTRFLPKKPKVEPSKPAEQHKETVSEKQPELTAVKEVEELKEPSRKTQRRKAGTTKKTKKVAVVVK